jgi:F0F1-type ATP synthase membrane subunit b/b'
MLAPLFEFVREYKDLITFSIGMLTAIVLIFVSSRIKAATKELKTSTDNAVSNIETAGSKLRAVSNDVDKSLAGTRQQMEETSRSLGASGRTLATQVALMEVKLGQSATKFNGEIKQSVADLEPQLQSAFQNAVDESSVELMKKLGGIKIELSKQIEDAIRDGVNRGATPSVASGDAGEYVGHPQELRRWTAMSDVWSRTKQGIDSQVQRALEHFTDGRSRRRYHNENINRHHYDEIAIKLYNDGFISEEYVDAAIEMNAIFGSKKNRKSPVSKSDLTEFERLSKLAD